MVDFKFNDYGVLTDGEIELVVRGKFRGGTRKGYIKLVPWYEFDVRLPGHTDPIGSIHLRIGNTGHIRKYGGHIAYHIDEEYRGHYYAAKACKLVKQVALDYGYKVLWITCNPDNYPSRRTCEILGCEFIEIVDLPEHTDMYQEGERQKCRYRWNLRKS